MSDYMEETGDPFTGKKKEELKKFLEYMGLTYDEQITHSIVLRKEKEIIATASCQKNIIKCVAVSEAYQGQNLLAHLMTSLIEYFYGMGISHFFVWECIRWHRQKKFFFWKMTKTDLKNS